MCLETSPGHGMLDIDHGHTLTIFFRPGNDANGNVVIDPSNGGNNAHNLSLLFNEALHGFTGKVEEDIQSAVGGLFGDASTNLQHTSDSTAFRDFMNRTLAVVYTLPTWTTCLARL